ncbi:reverse transcriptase domain-containing protein [Tanacetum coccineum]
MVRTERMQPARDLGDLVYHVGLLSTKIPREGNFYPSQRIFASTNWCHPWDPLFNLPKCYRMAALKELLKEPSNRDLIKPMLQDFNDIQDVSDEEIEVNEKGKAKAGDEDLIRAWFDKLPSSSIDNWGDLQRRFLNKFGMLKACDKDPTEISKIARRANETLPNFKERWVSESNAILNVPELMQIPSFMSSHKCPELSKRFSDNDNIPKTVDEMLKRVDDYLQSEEAFCIHRSLPRRGIPRIERYRLIWQVDIIVKDERKGGRVGGSRTIGPPRKAKVLVNPTYVEQLVVIGKGLSPEGSTQLKNLLKKNKYIFAWEPADMTGVPKRIIKHSLNANLSVTPASQKRRVFCSEKSRVITKEVAEWLRAGIVRPVKCPTWISNPVLVKKVDGSWRMCIEFKNINAACPKDYYPLPEIDSKIESVMGFPLKCFLDAYKGYHQVQMAEEYKEKPPSTWTRSQIRRNLEAYVDDMVVKSKSEREMLVDIAEIFDNLRRINMKLNQKKCLFGVKEGNHPEPGGDAELSRKVGSTKPVPLPISWKFTTFLRNIKGKANKHDYRWTEKTENAIQELKKIILDLPALTTPLRKKTLFIYLAASKEAVSAVLLVMALTLRHVSRRLRRYFEAHPITVITDQSIKQILSKVDTSGLVFISPTKTEYTYALRLNFESTNNYAEYEALLAGLKIAKKIGVQCLSINVDSKLVAIQINSNYKSYKENMIRYLSKAKEYISYFKNFKIQNIPQNKNQKADVLSKLSSVAFNHLTKEILVETLDVPSMDVKEINAVVEEEGETWMTPIINCLERGVWSEDQNEARALRMKIG